MLVVVKKGDQGGFQGKATKDAATALTQSILRKGEERGG